MNVKLVGIDDYLKGETTLHEHTVILRIKEGIEELYIMYNRAEGVNNGVPSDREKVTIVEQKGTPFLYIRIFKGHSFLFTNFYTTRFLFDFT